MKVNLKILRTLLVVSAIIGLTTDCLAQPPVLITPPDVETDYTKRENSASPAIKNKLSYLRGTIQGRGFTFQVGYTTAMDFPIKDITGLIPPDNLDEIIQGQIKASASIEKSSEVLQSTVDQCANNSKLDWRDNGVVSPVRDQGKCGSCWAFATHGAFEGSFLNKNPNERIDTAEQDTLDCSGKGSCLGGWWAHEYLTLTGTAGEADYPYTASDGMCQAPFRPYGETQWGYVSDRSETGLKKALCEYGPISCFLHNRNPQSCKHEFPTIAKWNSPVLQ